ncbi:MAG TPA: serine hydrolase [Candidatus Saccharimonadales bacterium]|nr:serine hydrolase [Candidatus Saccharimonadales bacterium]
MRILEFEEVKKRRDRRLRLYRARRRSRLLPPLLLILAAAYVLLVAFSPLPPLESSAAAISLPQAHPVTLPLPAYGQAAVSAVGYGLLANHGGSNPLPIASVAKVITAMAVLKVHPIATGTKGETITITDQDVERYNKYIDDGQSVIRVEAGEQLTEYQALQALLIPSANNIADALVNWAFGSNDEYLAFVNPFAKTLGMHSTTIADASGFSPKTTSTAVDLAKLAELATSQPIIADIVSQSQADLPVVGTVDNVNSLVGRNGIIGIKTGNTDEAGGCYLFAARRAIDAGHSVTVVGSIVGAPNLARALNDAQPLLDATFKNFQTVTPVRVGTVLGTISQFKGPSVPLVAARDLSLVAWNGQTIRSDMNLRKLSHSVSQGDQAGTLSLYDGTQVLQVPAIAKNAIAPHSFWWRLTHAAGHL